MHNAVTAPARPKPVGTRVLLLCRRPVDAEGGRRRIFSYAEGITTPTVILAGWPGGALRRRH
jgi:hypothetical protein